MSEDTIDGTLDGGTVLKKPAYPTPFIIQPHHLSGIAALDAAQSTRLHKMNGEMDTAFVKRIVCAYMNSHINEMKALQSSNQMKALIDLLDRAASPARRLPSCSHHDCYVASCSECQRAGL